MKRIKAGSKLFRILLFLFPFFLTGHGSAQGTDKKITIQNKNISLQEAFNQIEQQTGYSIAYEQSTLDLNKKTSLLLTDADIKETLNRILKDTEHGYKIKGYHIIVYASQKNDTAGNKAPLTQHIKGIVTDESSEQPIAFANVSIVNNRGLGTTTDSLGHFIIRNVPIGRYTIQTTFMGYEPRTTDEVLVTSSKEPYLQISLKENILLVKEVIIRSDTDKSAKVNPMVLTGGRMINMEEAGRFANGFDDPARLATAFAGVAGDIGTNAIAVRGNSPQFTQWRLEGIEIPNPTHFADVSGLGGGFLSALSTQVMGNFDFYNGAFTAEYNNALSGIFDTYMRTGNNQNYEHTFQVGLLGIDLASEGPISKKNGSSYIFNYRFSTTTLATGGDANAKYQDLSFKLNFPTQQAGTFSIWGLGLLDNNKKKTEDKENWETQADRQALKNDLEKFSVGLTHKHFFNSTTYLRSSFATSYSQDKMYGDQYLDDLSFVPVCDIRNRKWDIVFNSYLNKKFSARHTNRTGFTLTRLQYDLDYKISPDFGLNRPMERIAQGEGNSFVFSAFTTSVLKLTPALTANIGLTTQYFALNKNWTLEPRLSLKWKVAPRHALAAAYGLHSRRERLDYYFIEKNVKGRKESNKYLDLSKAHHFGLSYDWNITPSHHLKIEPYYQYLYNVPVEKGTFFSIINQTAFYLDRILINKGTGKNYGIDLTFEQYMRNGFYYMLTGSWFKSKYKGGDNIWRNTRFDRGFTLNAVAGKEWMIGKQKQNAIGLNGRLFCIGGSRYTPIDEDKSHQSHDVEFDETKAFSKKFNPSVNGDISFSYKINKRKLSHEFSLKILNIGGYTGMHYYQYDEKLNQIKKEKGIGVIPTISYKLYF